MKTVFIILAMTIFLGVTPNPCVAAWAILGGSGVVAGLSKSGVGPNAEAFVAAPVPAQIKKAHEVLTLQGGVLIDPVEKAIFVAKTAGGIEAIDIATGNTLWQTKQEEGMRWPVAVYGRTLVVRVRDQPLRIAALDLDAKGKMLWITEPVLPAWVKGPEWLEDKPRGNRVFPEWVPEQERAKPNPQEFQLALLNAMTKIKGAYR